MLDECHHVASLWGYVVRAVLEELGETHVIGLTATPPAELTGAETELYDGLLGPVDFEIPTPAVVKDGYLAPYQELAWITEPLASELAWLAEHDLRFQELVTALLDEDPALPHSLGGWVIVRVRERSRRRAASSAGRPSSAPSRSSRSPACAFSARPAWRCRATRPAASATASSPTSTTGSR